MKPIVVNFGDVESFSALPAGNYPIVIESVTVKEAKDTGNPYLNWDLKVSQGPSAGRHFFFMTSLLPQSLWRLKAIFDSLGVFQKYPEDNLTITPDPASGIVIEPQLVGLPGIAVVRQEMYQSRMQNKVDDILPMGGQAINSPPLKASPAQKAKTPTQGKMNLK